MGKRQFKVSTEWSANLAYAIGLIATDGNLSSNGRAIEFTSKDRESVENFRKCLGVNNKIGMKSRDREKIKKYFNIQVGDINFYEFLNSIGITAAKSKTIQKVNIPPEHFPDFLRGCIDGDGSITWSTHPESKHKQLRLRLYSASKPFLEWMKNSINKNFGINNGWISVFSNCNCLSYGKSDSLKIIELMYYTGVKYYLTRKYNLTRNARVV